MDVSQNERAHALRAALDSFRDVTDAGIDGDPMSPEVVVVMDGHKTAVPREIRELADALGMETPDVGGQSGENYEYNETPRRGLWTTMTFTQEADE